MSIKFDDIQAEVILLGRSAGVYPALTIDGPDCRLSDQKGNFVKFSLRKNDLDLQMSDFSGAILAHAVQELAEKAKT